MPTFLTIAATTIFLALALVVCLFQVALVAGVPWGERTLGGRWPGKLPTVGRAIAAFSILVLIALAVIVVAKSGLAFPSLRAIADVLIWVVVAYSALGTVANAATPSRKERNTWLPVVIILLFTSFTVAIV